MSSQVPNEFAGAVITQAKAMLGWPYVLGGISPQGIDCRGLPRLAFRLVGLIHLIGGKQPNVRSFVRWARENGRLRLAADGYVPQPGDLFFWGPDTDDFHPRPGHGHMGIVLEAPSAEYPNGVAISAYNPQRDTIIHRLIPGPVIGAGMALYGFLEPEWPAVEPEPPIIDPEPPPPDPLTDLEIALAENQALKAKVEAAKAALA